MTKSQHIDEILAAWPYEAESLNVRFAKGADGRQIIDIGRVIDIGVGKTGERERGVRTLVVLGIPEVDLMADRAQSGDR